MAASRISTAASNTNDQINREMCVSTALSRNWYGSVKDTRHAQCRQRAQGAHMKLTIKKRQAQLGAERLEAFRSSSCTCSNPQRGASFYFHVYPAHSAIVPRTGRCTWFSRVHVVLVV